MRDRLRKAGSAISQFLTETDDKYAKRIADMYLPDNRMGEGSYSGMEARARGYGAAFLGGIPLSEMRSKEEGRAPKALIRLNAAVRYGAPLIGIGLAAKGIQDLTTAYNNQTSGTLMPRSSQHVEALNAMLRDGTITSAQYEAML